MEQNWLTSQYSTQLKAEPYSLFHYWYKRCRMQRRCIFPLSLFAYSQVRGTVTPAIAGYFARIIRRDSTPSAMASLIPPKTGILHPAICTPKVSIHLHDCSLNRGSSLELRSSLCLPFTACSQTIHYPVPRPQAVLSTGVAEGLLLVALTKKLDRKSWRWLAVVFPLEISIIRGAHAYTTLVQPNLARHCKGASHRQITKILSAPWTPIVEPNGTLLIADFQ